MATQLNLVTAPIAEPVTLDDAKKHIRLDASFTYEDDQVTEAISVARERGELETGRQFLTATWELWLDTIPGQSALHPDGLGGGVGFDAGMSTRWLDWSLWWNRGFIDIPCAPLQSVVSIKYTDPSGVLQTWDPTQYQVTAPTGPTAPRGRIRPAYGVSWPVTRDQMASMVVQFKAGYGDTAPTVPAMLRRAIKLMVGDLFENRENTIVTKSRSTIQPLPYGAAEIFMQYRARPVTRES